MMRTARAAAAVALMGLLWVAVSAQGPTGLLSGQITLAGTGRPVDGAQVTITGAELRGSRSATTDDDGRFVFAELPAGTFTVRATLPGHIAGTWGQKSPGGQGTAIVMAAGQQRRDISFAIARGGVISGVVVDERNRPSIGTPVRVMRWLNQSGDRTLASVGTGTTDDRGLYRVYNLMPGEYLVSAVPRNATSQTVTVEQVQRIEELRALGLAGETTPTVTLSGVTMAGSPTPADAGRVLGYAPVFHPGTLDLAAARSVRVGISEEQLGIDIPLQRVPLTTVSGHVVVPNGQSPTTVQVRLLQSEGNAIGVGQVTVRPSQNGSFTVNSVVPGHYTVFATATAALQGISIPQVPQPAGMPPGQAPQRRLWARADLFVDGSYPPVVHLTMQEGRPVAGHAVFDGSAPPPQGPLLQRVRVTMTPLGQPLQSAGLGNLTAAMDAGGRFTMEGVVPGRYRVGATGASGWQVKQVMVNGVDVLDFPFVVEPGTATPEVTIRFGDRSTDLRGRLTDASGAPTSDYSVVIFPADPRYWILYARRMRMARPNTDGAFTFAGLPPGDYRLAAVTDVDAGEWLDPEFLRQLQPASIGVRLAEGQPTTQDIRVR